MHEQPAFNQENQAPDWKKVVIVWNGSHAKRNENEKFLRYLLLYCSISFNLAVTHHTVLKFAEM